MPVAVPLDSSIHSGSMDPSVVAGYTDCLKEALKFLLERERLPPQHPIVAGLAMHLARPGARDSLRRLTSSPRTSSSSSAATTRNSSEARSLNSRKNSPGGDPRGSVRRPVADHPSLSERSLHQVRNTSVIGKARVPPTHHRSRVMNLPEAPRSSYQTTSEETRQNSTTHSSIERDHHTAVASSSSSTGLTEQMNNRNAQGGRDLNGELRRNLQNIVDNLQDAIDNSNESDSDDSSYDDDDFIDVEADEDDSEENRDVVYDTNENDLDAEIDTILGDAALRRELARLVYQGCDLIATAPQHPTPLGYPSPPSSPQYGEVASPQYLPQEHVIHHIENDRF